MRFKLLVIILISFGITCCVSNDNSVSIRQEKKTIKSWRLIEQTGDSFIKKVEKIVCRNNKIYIQNFMSYQLLVFNEKEYVFALGKPGQGPDEIARIRSFFVDSNKIYILDFPDKFMIYDLQGNFLRSFKLTEKKSGTFENYNVHDFFVCNERIYICYGVQKPTIRIFSLSDGSYQEDLVNNPETETAGIGSLLNIYPDYKKGIIILSDNSSGTIHFYDLKTGKLLKTIDSIDEAIRKEAAIFAAECRKSQLPGIQVLSLMKTFISDNDGEVFLLPISGRKAGFLRYIQYSFGDNKAGEVRLDTRVIKKDFGNIENMIALDNENLMVIDDNGDLYKIKIGGIK